MKIILRKFIFSALVPLLSLPASGFAQGVSFQGAEPSYVGVSYSAHPGVASACIFPDITQVISPEKAYDHLTGNCAEDLLEQMDLSQQLALVSYVAKDPTISANILLSEGVFSLSSASVDELLKQILFSSRTAVQAPGILTHLLRESDKLTKEQERALVRAIKSNDASYEVLSAKHSSDLTYESVNTLFGQAMSDAYGIYQILNSKEILVRFNNLNLANFLPEGKLNPHQSMQVLDGYTMHLLSEQVISILAKNVADSFHCEEEIFNRGYARVFFSKAQLARMQEVCENSRL